jgi:hypothetical protein
MSWKDMAAGAKGGDHLSPISVITEPAKRPEELRLPRSTLKRQGMLKAGALAFASLFAIMSTVESYKLHAALEVANTRINAYESSLESCHARVDQFRADAAEDLIIMEELTHIVKQQVAEPARAASVHRSKRSSCALQWSRGASYQSSHVLSTRSARALAAACSRRHATATALVRTEAEITVAPDTAEEDAIEVIYM